jgi:maleate isomerase
MTERHRIGLLVPSSNTVMENDLHAHLDKARYTVHTARMYLERTTAEAERVMLDRDAPAAASLIGTVRPDVLVFGCTSAGSLGGVAYDRQVCAELGTRAGCRSIGVMSSLADCVREHRMHRVAVITPYIDELTASVASGLSQQGLHIVSTAGMGISVNVDLARPTPEEITGFVRRSVYGLDIDGIVVSCTNFRALEAKAAITMETGLPVITSNSAVLETIGQLCAARGATRSRSSSAVSRHC